MSEAHAGNGRDSNGKFAPGNPGGPGRPRRAIEMDYLRVFSEILTTDAWRAICQRAVEHAQQGEAKSREFVTRFALGPCPPSLLRLAAMESASLTSADEVNSEMRICGYVDQSKQSKHERFFKVKLPHVNSPPWDRLSVAMNQALLRELAAYAAEAEGNNAGTTRSHGSTSSATDGSGGTDQASPQSDADVATPGDPIDEFNRHEKACYKAAMEAQAAQELWRRTRGERLRAEIAKVQAEDNQEKTAESASTNAGAVAS